MGATYLLTQDNTSKRLDASPVHFISVPTSRKITSDDLIKNTEEKSPSAPVGHNDNQTCSDGVTIHASATPDLPSATAFSVSSSFTVPHSPEITEDDDMVLELLVNLDKLTPPAVAHPKAKRSSVSQPRSAPMPKRAKPNTDIDPLAPKKPSRGRPPLSARRELQRATPQTQSSSMPLTGPAVPLTTKVLREARDLVGGTALLGRLLQSRGSETMVAGDPMLILGVADVSPEERKKRKAERLRRFSEQMGFEATNLDPLSAVPMSGVFPLSELQRLISESIILSNGQAVAENIFQYVSQHWTEVRNPDGSLKNTDCKRAVITSLTKNIRFKTPIFEKLETPHGTKWTFGAWHPWLPALAALNFPTHIISATSPTPCEDCRAMARGGAAN